MPINTKKTATWTSAFYDLNNKNTALIIRNISDTNIVTLSLWINDTVVDYEWIVLYPRETLAFNECKIKYSWFSYKTVSWNAILSIHHA